MVLQSNQDLQELGDKKKNFQLKFNLMGHVCGFNTSPVVVFQYQNICIFSIDTLRTWQISLTLYLYWGVIATMVGKAKWKSASNRKTDNSKQYCILIGIAELSGTIRDLEDSGLVIPTTFSPNLSMQKINGSWKMMGDHCKFYQFLTPIPASFLDPYLSRLTHLIVLGMLLLISKCFFLHTIL